MSLRIWMLRFALVLVVGFILIGCTGEEGVRTVHVWESVEIELEAANEYENPYTDVDVWIELTGPGFDRRVYGFWDGDGVWRVRFLAAEPGTWEWVAGASVEDEGLTGQTGTVEAEAWTEAEKRVNPNRRGIVRATPNGHALQYADGTPFFMLSDTAYPLFTGRIEYAGEPVSDEVTPYDRMSFEELVAYRKNQGYNAFSAIASFPNWRPDGHTDGWTLEDGTVMRDAGSWSSDEVTVDMDYDGDVAPFELGGVDGMPPEGANYDRINPAYWQRVDRKMDHLWQEGMFVFLEGVRRDHRDSWKRWFAFEDSFRRYTRYLLARYGVYNMMYSPVHADYVPDDSYLDDFGGAITHWYESDGDPPFGNLVTVLAENTHAWFDDPEWMTAHNVGNTPRNNDRAEELNELFALAKPAFNSEPYYAGLNTEWGKPAPYSDTGPNPEPDTELGRYYVRTQAYYSILNGGLAGHVYGTAGWAMQWEDEEESNTTRHYAKTLQYASGADMGRVKEFVRSLGESYVDLEPARDLLDPNSNEGGAPDLSYAIAERATLMRTPDRSLAVAYFQPGTRVARVGGLDSSRSYRATWHRAVDAEPVSEHEVEVDEDGGWRFSVFPGGGQVASQDWLLTLTAEEPSD